MFSRDFFKALLIMVPKSRFDSTENVFLMNDRLLDKKNPLFSGRGIHPYVIQVKDFLVTLTYFIVVLLRIGDAVIF
jgi:hypothetical protein